jgi:GxxExxY protein
MNSNQSIEYINSLSYKIIGFAMQVHSKLGPGLLESAYHECLAYELTKAGISFVRQVPVPIIYKDVKLPAGYRSVLIVEQCVIVEIKSVELIHEVYKAQLLTYLKLSNIRVGLLINFNCKSLTSGITRLIV